MMYRIWKTYKSRNFTSLGTGYGRRLLHAHNGACRLSEKRFGHAEYATNPESIKIHRKDCLICVDLLFVSLSCGLRNER
jgi:hypothetical protein